MNLKASERSFKRENMNPTYTFIGVSLAVMIPYCFICIEQKVNCDGILGGGVFFLIDDNKKLDG